MGKESQPFFVVFLKGEKDAKTLREGRLKPEYIYVLVL